MFKLRKLRQSFAATCPLAGLWRVVPGQVQGEVSQGTLSGHAQVDVRLNCELNSIEVVFVTSGKDGGTRAYLRHHYILRLPHAHPNDPPVRTATSGRPAVESPTLLALTLGVHTLASHTGACKR
jgi:hypothetical protein